MAGAPTVIVVTLTATVILLARPDLVPAACLPGACFFGAISYSLYLIHVPVGGRVINLGRRLGDGPLIEAASIVAALAVSILFAWIFARLVEMPSIRAAKMLEGRARERRSWAGTEVWTGSDMRARAFGGD
jgi:peptidoglycan/LPS O-acetylase OafA/YrhL